MSKASDRNQIIPIIPLGAWFCDFSALNEFGHPDTNYVVIPEKPITCSIQVKERYALSDDRLDRPIYCSGIRQSSGCTKGQTDDYPMNENEEIM